MKRRLSLMGVTFSLFEAVVGFVLACALAAELWLVMFVVFGTVPQ